MRRRLLLISYAPRVLTMPGHPFNTLIKSYYSYQSYQDIPITGPIEGRIHAEYKKLSISYASTPLLPLVQRYTSCNQSVYCTLHTATNTHSLLNNGKSSSWTFWLVIPGTLRYTVMDLSKTIAVVWGYGISYSH